MDFAEIVRIAVILGSFAVGLRVLVWIAYRLGRRG